MKLKYNKTVDGRLKRNSRPLAVLFHVSFISPCATGLSQTALKSIAKKQINALTTHGV